MVDEDECGHGFHDGDGAWEDAGVVAAAAFDLGVIAEVVDGFLGFKDGRSGFEGDAEVDFLAVADAALDAA